MKKTAFVAVILSTLIGCGGGGGGSDDTVLGANINDGFELPAITCNSAPSGTFTDASSTASVTIAASAATMCVNSTSTPTLTAIASLPDGFDLNAAEGDLNVTAGGAGYAFDIMGDRGFVTATEGAVTITLPIDTATIPPADLTTPKISVRIFDPDDGSLATVTGTITGASITIDTQGLPRVFTAAVIYNPNMTAVASIAASAMVVKGWSKAAATTWNAQQLFTSLAALSPGLAQTQIAMENAVKTFVANLAAEDQTVYQRAGFLAPVLYVAKTAADPCGAALGTTPRHLMHIDPVGTHYAPVDPDSTITESKYGRINIQPDRVATPVGNGPGERGSVKGIIAHELLHAIQYRYNLNVNDSEYGYMEGTSTVYGVTIDQGGTISVRSINTGETFKLADFLTVDGYNTWPPYSNQDFFAYVGSEYNAGNLAYIADLYTYLKQYTDTEAASYGPVTSPEGAAKYYMPARATLYNAMNAYFQLAFAGATLKDVYLDFLRARAMEHNAASQLRAGDPTVSGILATDLFKASEGGMWEVSIDPLNVMGSSRVFGAIAPYAARAVRIKPSQSVGAGGTGAHIIVTVAPVSGSIGATFDGYSYQNGVRAALASSNTFANFGLSTSDEIVILVAKTSNDDTREDLRVTVEGENGTGGGGGGASTFTLDTFSLPGEPLWSPAWVTVTPDTGMGVIIGAIAASTDLTDMARFQNLQVQFGTASITGAGTYTIVGDDPSTGPAAVLYSPGTDAAIAGTGHVYESTGGTLTLSSWDTATGAHITGTVSAAMASDEATPQTGTLDATFDFIVGSGNAL